MRTSFIAFVMFGMFVSVSPMLAQSSNTQQAAASVSADVLARVTKVKGLKLASSSSLQAPEDVSCLANFGVPCYSPQQMQTAYGLTPILQAGYTGAGQTIVIIDSFGSPTIAQDLKTF
jgi:subtilase family serine protease